jgi:hypothetical protein
MAKGKLTIDTSPIKQLEKECDDGERFFKLYNEIKANICKKLTSWARSAMESTYNKSSLRTKSGRLLSMIRRAEVVPTKSGFTIRMPKGFSAVDYAKAGALQYGAVHGASGISGRARKKLKTNAKKQGDGHAKPHPYFFLDAGQVSTLTDLYQKHLQDEYDSFMKRGG